MLTGRGVRTLTSPLYVSSPGVKRAVASESDSLHQHAPVSSIKCIKTKYYICIFVEACKADACPLSSLSPLFFAANILVSLSRQKVKGLIRI